MISSVIDHHFNLLDAIDTSNEKRHSWWRKALALTPRFSKTVKVEDSNKDGSFVLSVFCPFGIGAHIQTADKQKTVKISPDDGEQTVVIVSSKPHFRIEAWEEA